MVNMSMFTRGQVLFATMNCPEAVEEAKAYCVENGYTPKEVAIQKTYKKDSDEYEMVVVKVL